MSDEAARPAAIHVLVAVHEEHRAQLVSTFLRNRGHHVACVRDGRGALHALRDEAFDVAVLDVSAHEADGLELVHQLRVDTLVEPPELIVITGNESGETAIGALRLGAYAHLPKPYRMAEIDVLIRRAFEKRQLARENRYLREHVARIDGDTAVITRSAPLRAILALAERIAAGASSVLISGERGTGKRRLARRIHEASGRLGPFVEVRNADASDLALEIELFGRSRDSSAVPARTPGQNGAGGAGGAGLLELASHGTLFVASVGSLPLKVQGRLLRALEHGSFLRVGGTQRVEVTARLIATTTEDLDAAASSGLFNQGLLRNVRTIAIAMPPLRERRADVPLLAQHFLRELGGASSPVLLPEAIARLQAHDWPGNVRELRNLMERLVLTTPAAGAEIGPDALHLPTDRAKARTQVGADVTVGELERQHIEAVLERAGWHQGRAAAMLGVSASTLYRKMRDLGIRKPAKRRLRRRQGGRLTNQRADDAGHPGA